MGALACRNGRRYSKGEKYWTDRQILDKASYSENPQTRMEYGARSWTRTSDPLINSVLL